MNTNKIPSHWRACATCTHWCGKKNPNVFGTMIEYDIRETARCVGGGFNGCKVTGLTQCREWEPQFKGK